MCGIVGIAGRFDRANGLDKVRQMNDSIIHRGPDDEGVYASDNFAFAMRRLSIIDLSSGHQPMWSGEKNGDGIGIVFNGEIYNYRELANDLKKQGSIFRTRSDTEVVLRLYEKYGLDGLLRLNGMFAICIYDKPRSKIHLLRDRIGIKPLYYGNEGKNFYFASEIKALLAGMETRQALDQQSLHHYLSLRYVPAPNTMWSGIKKLPPANRLTFDLRSNEYSIVPYWSVNFQSKEIDKDRDYVGEFETLFLSAIEKRLVASDVPVGVMLSGGLDSSALSAAAVELGHKAFNTFSVAFEDGGDFSELKYARQVSKSIGSVHHEVTIGQKEFMDTLPEVVHYMDEPMADLATIPLFHVSKLAREHVKVVLSGEGSDEILAGYDMEQVYKRLQKLKSIPKIFAKLLHPLIPGSKGKSLKYLAQGGWNNYLKYRGAYISSLWGEGEKNILWNEEKKFISTSNLIKDWYELSSSPNPLDQMQQAYCHSWLVEDLLMKADKMSMANSLELRVPFLDHQLVEWASQLPMTWKVGDENTGWSSKRVLREFSRRRLPIEIINRPKQGFPVPAYGWLTGSLGSWAESRFSSTSKLSDYFDMSPVHIILKSAKAGNTLSQHKVWSLLVLEQWLEQWQ